MGCGASAPAAIAVVEEIECSEHSVAAPTSQYKWTNIELTKSSSFHSCTSSLKVSKLAGRCHHFILFLTSCCHLFKHSVRTRLRLFETILLEAVARGKGHILPNEGVHVMIMNQTKMRNSAVVDREAK